MKTPLLYGSLIAIVGALLTFGLFFAGFHDTPEKLKSTQWIAPCVILIAHFVLVTFAIRDARSNYPAEEKWSYGNALGCGFLTGLVAAICGIVIGLIYYPLVNPQFGDVLFQTWYAQAEAKGYPADRLEAASGFMHKIYSPAGLSISNLITGLFVSLVLALIIAIFFRKRASDANSIASAEPPAVPPGV